MAPHATETDHAPKFSSSSSVGNGFTSPEAQQRWAHLNKLHNYSITEAPLNTFKRIRIICIGAGASSINFLRDTQIELQNVDVVAYEKNPEVGGTWYENTYNGCACDIPAHAYVYTYFPNPNWSCYYAGSKEICQYFKSAVDHFGLGQYIKLNSRVVGCKWNDATSKWHVTVQQADRTFEDTCDVLIGATGVLNSWKWPNVPGLNKFKGTLAHSASWPKSLDFTDKSVAVIGAGSSGVQIVSNITPLVGKLINFIRSPIWITAGFAQKFAGADGGNFNYTDEQKARFAADPELALRYRKSIENELNQRFKFILNGSEEQKEATLFSYKEMQKKLGNRPELMEHIVPKNFAVACRRPTPSNGYLEALTDPKVTVVPEAVTEVTETGVISASGKRFDVDVIICATGFDVSYKPRFPFYGRNGVDLAEQWKDSPESYLSFAINGFPNFFFPLGPHCPGGHGSILPITEQVSKYFCKMISKLQRESIRSFEPKEEAVLDFKIHRETYLQRTAWSQPCRSWFKNGKTEGPIMMYPGSRLHFFDMIKEPRFEDYNWEYETQNRFQYMGNGFVTREFDGSDLSYYMGLLEKEGDRLPTTEMPEI